jgi:hypothetical protein
MFDFWYDLPPLLRALMGLGLIAVAAGIYFATGGTRVAVGVAAIGLIFLVFCQAGDDGSGYKF